MLEYCQYASIFSPDRLPDIQQLALAFLQTQPVTVCQVMSFLGKAIFCANDHSQPCHAIQSDMLTVYYSSAHLFSSVQFSFSALHQLQWLSHLHQSHNHLQSLPTSVVIATDAMSNYWAFLSGLWIAVIS